MILNFNQQGQTGQVFVYIPSFISLRDEYTS
jgi:hypothetical protein